MVVSVGVFNKSLEYGTSAGDPEQEKRDTYLTSFILDLGQLCRPDVA